MDLVTQRKWDRAAKSFDVMNGKGPEWRWGPTKRELFSHMEGKILFLAVGTGLDFEFFPPGRDILGLDISPGMLEKASEKVGKYDGRLELRQMDVHELDLEDGSFDQVYTSCTFCSVPKPVQGLVLLRRLLRPGGELRMFEHTGSRWFPFSVMLNAMNPIARRLGPEVNRDTPANVVKAGFEIKRVYNVYLDVVRTIYATVPT